MSTPDDARLPPRGPRERPNAHLDQARQVLWQELQHGQFDYQFSQSLERLWPDGETLGLPYLAAAAPQLHNIPIRDDVSAARAAIWRLFDAGLIDHSSATVALLAIHVGVQRMTGHD